MYCEYEEKQKQEIIKICRMELLALEYEEREVSCIGRTLRDNVRSASAGPTANLTTWTQLWERMIKARDNAMLISSPWFCPGIAACAAVLAKLMIR